MFIKMIKREDKLIDTILEINLNDKAFLERIIDFAKENNIAEIEIQEKERRIRIKRREISQVVREALPPLVRKEELPSEEEVKVSLKEEHEKVVSPLSGTFYQSSSPEAEHFVKVGDRVSHGATLAMIEAMKMFNEIKSEVEGEIVEILTVSEEVVKEGQPLFLIKKENNS